MLHVCYASLFFEGGLRTSSRIYHLYMAIHTHKWVMLTQEKQALGARKAVTAGGFVQLAQWLLQPVTWSLSLKLYRWLIGWSSRIGLGLSVVVDALRGFSDDPVDVLEVAVAIVSSFVAPSVVAVRVA